MHLDERTPQEHTPDDHEHDANHRRRPTGITQHADIDTSIAEARCSPSSADASLIDRVGHDLRDAASLLSLAGLGDAFVMLRREAELSDGQRFRFRLALAMEAALAGTNPAAHAAQEDDAAIACASPLVPAKLSWASEPSEPSKHSVSSNSLKSSTSSESLCPAESLESSKSLIISTPLASEPRSSFRVFAKTRNVEDGVSAASRTPNHISPRASPPRSSPTSPPGPACASGLACASGPASVSAPSTKSPPPSCPSSASNPHGCFIVADEFAATLDRLTAKTIARGVRRWIDRSACERAASITLIVATTHDDLLESLHPEVLVLKVLGDQVEVLTR